MVFTIPSNITAAYKVQGPIDRHRLHQALVDVCRSCKAFEGGVRAADVVVSPTAFVDLSGSGEEELGRLVRREARSVFEVGTETLLRMTVARCGEDHHVVLFTMHQLIGDRRSLSVVARRVAQVYGGVGLEGMRDSGEEFRSFAQRQKQWLQSEGGQQAARYWEQQLRGVAVLRLPGDFVRPAVKAASLVGSRCYRRLPVQLARGLRSMGESVVGGERSILLAGYEALLFRYSGEKDFAVGCPVENRSGEQGETVGPFENTWVIRTEVGDDPGFAQLVGRVGASWAKAAEHGQMPLEWLIQKLQSPGDVVHSPLFQVQMLWEDAPAAWTATGELRWEPLEVDTGLCAFDLTLRGRRRGSDEVVLELEYSTDLFSASRAERMLGHLERLLQSGLSCPELRVSQLMLLSPEERAQLTVEWNATEAEYPRQSCLHDLIAEQARRTPHAIAVTAPDGQLSYGELDQRANGLAAHLRSLGVAPEARVGVLAERTAATMIGLLGVLKAGAAYVPIDPDCPPERLQYMLQNAGIAVVLARPEAAEKLSFGQQLLVDPNREWGHLTTPPATHVDPLNLAYVIYTSGSTGQPKAVLVPHRQIVNSTCARWGAGRFSPGSYVMPAPLTFDASAAGIYWSLCTGGRLVLPDSKTVQDPRLLARFIQDERATHTTAMPSFYGLLLGTGVEALRSLRDISVGGDVVHPSLVREHHQVLPWAQFYNDYGPTEGAVWTTAHLCSAHEPRGSISIGRPIQNARVYLLDLELNPQPIGVIGELYIGGEGVARGYLGAPALTAERFLPDLFAIVPGQRMYRTGDLARYREDGDLEFIGRVDNQIKIRGLRVELGEIEAALRAHPAVVDAVVLAREQRLGDKRLFAYVVARSDSRLATEPLVQFLKLRIPAHMIPHHFTLMDQLPRNSNLKVDRKVLGSIVPTAEK